MTTPRIQAAIDAAKAIHEDIKGSVSVDALFVALYIDSGVKVTRPYKKTEPATMPDEVRDALATLQGRQVTAAEIYRAAYWVDATPSQAKQVGGWMRGINKHPRKSNGRLVYVL